MNQFDKEFSSRDYREVANFYQHFSDSKGLVEWMIRREDGPAEIYEIQGDTSVVVVILTMDHKNRHPTICSDQIFKGLHIVFVENGQNDPLFNFARNSNIGLSYALKYQPDWVIQTGDDMYKIDDVSILSKALSEVDKNEYDTIFTNPPTMYHSHREYIGKRNLARRLYYKIADQGHKIRKKIEDRFAIDYMIRPAFGISKIMLKPVESILLTQAFGIFSSKFLRKFDGKPYDRTYINNIEEFDLSYRLNKNARRMGFVDYRVGDYKGASFGNGYDRWMRSIASEVYFNYKLTNHLSPFEDFKIPEVPKSYSEDVAGALNQR